MRAAGSARTGGSAPVNRGEFTLDKQGKLSDLNEPGTRRYMRLADFT